MCLRLHSYSEPLVLRSCFPWELLERTCPSGENGRARQTPEEKGGNIIGRGATQGGRARENRENSKGARGGGATSQSLDASYTHWLPPTGTSSLLYLVRLGCLLILYLNVLIRLGGGGFCTGLARFTVPLTPTCLASFPLAHVFTYFGGRTSARVFVPEEAPEPLLLCSCCWWLGDYASARIPAPNLVSCHRYSFLSLYPCRLLLITARLNLPFVTSLI